MHIFRSIAAACIAACTLTAVQAQLKPGGGTGLAVPAPGTAPAARNAPAPGPAPATATAGAETEKEAAGKLAAAGWLVLLDRRDWGRAWETTAGMFRNAVTLGAWMDGVPKVREPLGGFVERAPATSHYRTKLEGRPDGEYVTVIFKTKFDKREAEETVTTVREPDGRWRVTGYSVK